MRGDEPGSVGRTVEDGRARRRVVTTTYPASRSTVPRGPRSNIRLDAGLCTGCADCVPVCPTQALQSDGPVFTVDHGACIACGLCVPACPEGALSVSYDFELAARSRRDLVETVPVASPGRVPEEAAAARLREEIGRLFRGSLHIREVDAGSCNGCEVEVSSLSGPYYDLERLGIQFVASPRHADLAMVTGPPTRHMVEALRATYEAMPGPKLVVAVGACGIMGGPFAGSYGVVDGVDRVLPVDAYIPGCPPRPEALIQGLLLAVGRFERKMDAGRRPQREVVP